MVYVPILPTTQGVQRRIDGRLKNDEFKNISKDALWPNQKLRGGTEENHE
jgi:hypothetical protein